jgi:hypothetical protein
MKTGIELIAEERQRQIEVEGWTSEHDKQHICGDLSDAAVCYAMRGYWRQRIDYKMIWPFSEEWFKSDPDNRTRDLVKAGALIAAEIDRINNSKP